MRGGAGRAKITRKDCLRNQLLSVASGKMRY